jgi:ribose/xylose/arabinose/galactoside ABC-type transport system permease subunit
MSSPTEPHEKSERVRAAWFGGGSLVVFGAIGGWLLYRGKHPEVGMTLSALGAALALLAVAWPRGALSVRAVWMKFAHALGWVQSRVILTVFFVLLLTPWAVLSRWLRRRSDPGAKSYWRGRDREHDPRHHDHPY